ncbi:MAG: MBL fold metallo-hydrolase [Pseudonocardia sp.]|nr:MBL fold metallo-hydrolase [Pseudonocardia sp.]
MDLDLDHPVCATCGVQYEPGVDRSVCPICADDREHVAWGGQQWTSLRGLATNGHRNEVREEVPGLTGIGTTPSFGIAQRALLVPGEGGNVLWDCTPLIGDDALARIRELGGVAAIALSHPHYYSTMATWSRALGDIPIYVHARDEQWVPRRDNVVFWEGERREILPGRTLLNAGVHFAGGTVLHWDTGVDGRGALCAGDIFTVVPDRRWVGFMYSYPNLIPERPARISRALHLTATYRYSSLYSAWWGYVITDDAHGAVLRSAHRYFEQVGAPTNDLPALPRPPSAPDDPAPR